MDINELKVDATLETEGRWVPISDDAEILVARLYNPNFNRVLEAKRKPHGRRVLKDVKLQERLFRETLAETVLLDWKGMTEGGKPIKYSKETALRFLTDVREFANIVTAAADDLENFQKDEEEDDKGN